MDDRFTAVSSCDNIDFNATTLSQNANRNATFSPSPDRNVNPAANQREDEELQRGNVFMCSCVSSVRRIRVIHVCGRADVLTCGREKQMGSCVYTARRIHVIQVCGHTDVKYKCVDVCRCIHRAVAERLSCQPAPTHPEVELFLCCAPKNFTSGQARSPTDPLTH